MPLEHSRAVGIFTGLVMFGGGFLLAALAAAATRFGSPGYMVAITIGFVGVGVVGFFLNRGTVPLPPGAIWSPSGLAFVAEGLGWPARAVQVVVYGLIAAGFLGNVLLPGFG